MSLNNGERKTQCPSIKTPDTLIVLEEANDVLAHCYCHQPGLIQMALLMPLAGATHPGLQLGHFNFPLLAFSHGPGGRALSAFLTSYKSYFNWDIICAQLVFTNKFIAYRLVYFIAAAREICSEYLETGFVIGVCDQLI